jgi:hypothetical protein
MNFSSQRKNPPPLPLSIEGYERKVTDALWAATLQLTFRRSEPCGQEFLRAFRAAHLKAYGPAGRFDGDDKAKEFAAASFEVHDLD